jgi:hypothetical protein
METTRNTKLALVVLFLGLICMEGPVQAVLDWRAGDQPQILELFSQTPTQKNLRSFETALEDNAWSAEAVRPATRYLRYAATGSLGAKAIQGRDDWLFYRPGTEFLIQPWPEAESGGEANDPLDAIVNFREALTARGIDLLVVIAPGKASIYPDKLSTRAQAGSPTVTRHAQHFMERLAADNIAHVDLFAVYAEFRTTAKSEPLYLERDTHWTPAGLGLAAHAVATRILDEGWIQRGEVAYREVGVPVEHEGDVLRMTNSDLIASHFTPEPVTAQQVVDSETGKPYEDRPESRVLVLGDSFLRIFQNDAPESAGFIAQLARELGQPLTSIVSDGGASTLVRQELARKPGLLSGKKLVIWEFVERDLRFGMEGWQKVALGD